MGVIRKFIRLNFFLRQSLSDLIFMISLIETNEFIYSLWNIESKKVENEVFLKILSTFIYIVDFKACQKYGPSKRDKMVNFIADELKENYIKIDSFVCREKPKSEYFELVLRETTNYYTGCQSVMGKESISQKATFNISASIEDHINDKTLEDIILTNAEFISKMIVSAFATDSFKKLN